MPSLDTLYKSGVYGVYITRTFKHDGVCRPMQCPADGFCFIFTFISKQTTLCPRAGIRFSVPMIRMIFCCAHDLEDVEGLFD